MSETANQSLPGGIWTLSAGSAAGLRAQARQVGEHLWAAPAALGRALAERPAAEFRAAVLPGSSGPAEALAALAAGTPSPEVVTGRVRANAAARPVFVFPGQGGQWAGMGADLLDSAPVFAGAIGDCEAALGEFTDWTVTDVLRRVPGAPALEGVAVVQPVLWAVQVALAVLWRGAGLEPAAIIGASVGEVAAATVAGALSLPAAARVVARRAQALSAIAGQGAMLAVALDADTVTALLTGRPGLSIGAVNGARSTVVTGERTAVEKLGDDLHADGVRVRAVAIDYASHSPQIESVQARLRSDLAGLAPGRPAVPLWSPVTGEPLEEPPGVDHWYLSERRPIRFDAAVRALVERGHNLFVEVSPHPVLTAAIQETLDEIAHPAGIVATLRRDQGSPERWRRSVAEAFVRGADVDRRAWFPDVTAAELTITDDETVDAPAVPDVRALVEAHTGALLGLGSGVRPDPGTSFKGLGFDSQTAIELRNLLAEALGLRLPAGLIFSHPTVDDLVDHLSGRLAGTPEVRPLPRRRTDPDEPVAIIGMACTFPGGADSPEQLWRLVADEVDATTGFPQNRGWDLAGLFSDDPDASGTSYARRGGFLPDADRFDPAFFGISRREALAMDPQQRLMLQTTWEALERADIRPETLRGRPVGVFVGAMAQDYGPRLHQAGNGTDGYLLTGTTPSVLSGRLAYHLGVVGAALTVDTACSSSLVALHLGVAALRSGECELALAGGVAVMSNPGMFVEFSRQRGLAPDGRCKPFAAAADGTAWGEGAGVLALERLADARAAGHRVLAVVRGSAVNQDGASNGLTAPNGASQEAVIRAALAGAGLAGADVDAIEAHGTGTALGDPIEAEALLATYGQDRAEPLWLGSLKSNIGHAQAAAGVGGVIKMVMAMRHAQLPATLGIDAPTPAVDWDVGAVRLLTKARDWPAGERPRRAGVSSFGISGTNAHVVIEEAGRTTGERIADDEPSAIPVPWVLSARTPATLAATASRLVALADLDPRDVGASLATTRTTFGRRAVVLGPDADARRAALTALAAGEPSADVVRGGDSPFSALAYLFPGQGAQRAGLGRELAGAFPVFDHALDEVCAEVDRHLPRPLRELLHAPAGSPDAALLDRTDVTQPAVFTIEVAVYRLLQSFGLRADVLVGHSVGEIAAAHVAGVLDLPDAAHLVAVRARLMNALPGAGAMVAVEAREDEVLPLLGRSDRVSVAAVNAPGSVVISGDVDQVLAVAEQLGGRGRRTRRLAVSAAPHSPLTEPMLAEFRDVVGQFRFHRPTVPIVSTVTGRPAGDELSHPDYWVRHVRQTVRFADAVTTVHADGARTFLELGPDGILSAMTGQCLPDVPTLAAVPVFRAGRSENRTLVEALATAHVGGNRVDWAALESLAGRHTGNRPDLPTYPFERERFWTAAAPVADLAGTGLEPADHPLLGAALSVAASGAEVLTGRLSIGQPNWLADHVIDGTVLLPGAAQLDLALSAARRAGSGGLAELVLEAPLVLPGDATRTIQVSVGPDGDVAVHTGSPDGEWVRLASGSVGTTVDAEPVDTGWAVTWPPPGATSVPLEDAYDTLAVRGYHYGPAFRGLTALWSAGDDVFAEVALAPEQAEAIAGHTVHPALLDAALHPILLAAERLGLESPGPGRMLLPFAWQDVRLLATAGVARARVRASRRPRGDGVALDLATVDGLGLITVGAVVFRPVATDRIGPPQGILAEEQPQNGLFAVGWTEVPAGPARAPELLRLATEPRTADVVGEAHRLAARALEAVQARLGRGDDPLVVVTRGAVVATPGDVLTDPAAATVHGLIRSAVTEHPGRFVLVDLDPQGTDDDAGVLRSLPPGEPEIAVRGGRFLAPRLTPVTTPGATPGVDEGASLAAALAGTVLITGGGGALAALLARHLVNRHGARHLLLTGRRGSSTPGITQLAAELTAAGAEVQIEAADVGERAEVERLLAAVAADHPLTAVIHTAGVLDDATVESLTPQRLAAVLRPKVDAAWHLHDLTRSLDPAMFAMFSSAVATLGNAGQANYAAGNAFQDALAAVRRHDGQPGTALGWGLWQQNDGMAAELSAADVARMSRSGLAPLPADEGVALFAPAIASGLAQVLPISLDAPGLRRAAGSGPLPALFRGLAAPARRARSVGASPAVAPRSVVQQLAGLDPQAQEELLVGAVRATVGAVLAHPDPPSIDVGVPFKELGFDSLTAVELRNRLIEVLGTPLPSTLAFDYPTVAAIVAFVRESAVPRPPSGHDRAREELRRLEGFLAGLGAEDEAATWFRKSVRELLGVAGDDDEDVLDEIESASDSEIFALLDDMAEADGEHPGLDDREAS